MKKEEQKKILKSIGEIYTNEELKYIDLNSYCIKSKKSLEDKYYYLIDGNDILFELFDPFEYRLATEEEKKEMLKKELNHYIKNSTKDKKNIIEEFKEDLKEISYISQQVL